MNIFESLENLSVSEECFDSIMGLVEEYIQERNEENRQKKKEWEISRGSYPENPVNANDTAKRALEMGELSIKRLKKDNTDSKDKGAQDTVVNTLAKGNRIILGRHQNPVSYDEPSEVYKRIKGARVQQSQRGSVKDPAANVEDETGYPGRVKIAAFAKKLKKG